MKSLVILFVFFSLTFTHVYGQEQSRKENPDEQIIVNKKYDEYGNLIGYDSTYIHQWSSDSTFDFSFPGGDFFAGRDFTDMENFFEEFFGDSLKPGFAFPHHFDISPFDREDFYQNFNRYYSDSVSIKNFNLNIDSLDKFQYKFEFPDIKKIQEQLRQQFENFDFPVQPIPDVLNEEQKKELEELQKKQQKEIEELMKKWNKD